MQSLQKHTEQRVPRYEFHHLEVTSVSTVAQLFSTLSIHILFPHLFAYLCICLLVVESGCCLYCSASFLLLFRSSPLSYPLLLVFYEMGISFCSPGWPQTCGYSFCLSIPSAGWDHGRRLLSSLASKLTKTSFFPPSTINTRL